ncbi:MAG: phosphoglucosamine mutase [Bacteroidales bacterium]|jgi:phosphomannomutase|nr:phosphoglucosamine mutase [Bacteroidales bacterium]
MPLIKSISGLRGTVVPSDGEYLSVTEVINFTRAYCLWLKKRAADKNTDAERLSIIVGCDGRRSGQSIIEIVTFAATMSGINVLYFAYNPTTPTVAMSIIKSRKKGNSAVYGGIMITASHNPEEWNGLKFFNEEGEFLSASDAECLMLLAQQMSIIDFPIPTNEEKGKSILHQYALQDHAKAIAKLQLVQVKPIKRAKFRVAVDAINSAGGRAVPRLLHRLGVKDVVVLNENMNQTPQFAHNPEPLPENITELRQYVVDNGFDVGFAVDPDVDRLAIVCENGEPFGEEYTLAAVADYVLQYQKGKTVSNLSSSQVLKLVTQKHCCQYYASAVGEVNVVEIMKSTKAVIGGEGNGGIIYPALHYGRDALVGIALFLSFLAQEKCTVSQLRARYPNFYMAKNKIQLPQNCDMSAILQNIQQKYQHLDCIDIDGLKIYLPDDQWVHLRKSNTEPIIRIYAESKKQSDADALTEQIINDIQEIVQ